MSDHHLVFYTKDVFGTIKVLEDGKYRLLSFAEGDEQSRIQLATPTILQHEYTQAMMLVLLFSHPKRLTVLGVGGGCLINCLHQHVSGVHITGVELRADVIDIAYRYFNLARSKRIQILEQDATSYLTNKQKKADIIFTDLYHATGMEEAVLKTDFLTDCASQLKENGWLVLNCWEGQYHYDDLITRLQAHFVDIRYVNTGTANHVFLAGKISDDQNAKQLKQKAQKLSSSLGFPLTKWLNRLVVL
ncbi:spermidine synthase [Marinomonas agarivorans]|nr:spermidine synthase [Marinomonas agarivorans]